MKLWVLLSITKIVCRKVFQTPGEKSMKTWAARCIRRRKILLFNSFTLDVEELEKFSLRNFICVAWGISRVKAELVHTGLYKMMAGNLFGWKHVKRNYEKTQSKRISRSNLFQFAPRQLSVADVMQTRSF